MIQPELDAKGIQLSIDLDASPCTMRGDAGRLQQVVWNLLTNAIKFTPKGGRIQVFLERAQSQAEIRVTDNGVGINPEFLPFVFDRFKQSDTAAAREYGGLGLGLSIARQLVEAHDGEVRIACPPTGGTTVTVRLPLSAVVGNFPDHVEKSAPPTSATSKTGAI